MYLQDKKKKHCTGCRACADICPKGCISMKEDGEGFLYPVIDSEQCIQCHLCERVCPVGYDAFSEKDQTDVWAGVYDSSDVICKSSSGGAFTAIYEQLLELNYVVYGVCFDENLKVKHAMADSSEGCKAFRKSKYVLGDTNHCYPQIRDRLKNGEKVLFTGTPCQCAALLQFLALAKVDTANLITVDLICHGAPNQTLFDSYVKELEQRENSRVTEYSFRSKTPIERSVNSRSAKIVFANGSVKTVLPKDDPFLKAYYSRLCYRPSCKVCPFAKPQRVSDITLGDAWAIELLYPEWDPLAGVSLILANNEKGKGVVERIKDTMTLRSVTIDWATQSNRQLREPTEFHDRRRRFFRRWKKRGFSSAVAASTKDSLYWSLYAKVKRRWKRLMRGKL
ncbi:MAG: Coenzyme F420 hydrogenase/dehydrogenase, beta subunit C-terminal domain [Clostridia bacterium]|nr:Coenzyme F420 hydrogenase/dehydrogenase, beta subunit C-terminal domain [Clostridia bacterium]